MNRIRTIKPEFFTSEDILALHRDVRLTFIGLWSYADDYGNGNANPLLLKASLWPLDHDIGPEVVDQHLDQLADAGLIEFYDIGTRTYYTVTAWSKHQKVDRPSPSNVPAPPEIDDSYPARERDTTPLASEVDSHSRPNPEPARGGGEGRESARGGANRERESEPGESEPSAGEPSESTAGERHSRAPDYPPSPFCKRHQPAGTEGPCRACGTARLANEQWVRTLREHINSEHETGGINDET